MFTNADLLRIARNQKPKKKSTKKKASPEGDFTNTLITHYLADGWLVIRINSGMVKTEQGFPFFAYTVANNGSHSGFPDLLLMKGNEYKLIEVKATKGRMSENQKRFQLLAEQKGVKYEVVSPSSFPQGKKGLV